MSVQINIGTELVNINMIYVKEDLENIEII